MHALRRLGVIALLALLGACAAPARDPLQVMAITGGGDAYQREREAFATAALDRVLARADRIARGETGDDALDILALSGGADWGAFGAGYLARWSELGAAAAVPMPEFDVVAGISTGALIGAYIAAGTPERYAGIEAFYRSTNRDWIELRGIGSFFPGSSAVLDNSGIQAAVDQAVDDELIGELRDAHAADRIVAVGTTNLDFASLKFFDLGFEASSRPDPAPRIVDILMAATAIPGAFPPVEIDGELHADGGAVQGVPGLGPRSLPGFAEVWRENHGDEPPPPLRCCSGPCSRRARSRCVRWTAGRPWPKRPSTAFLICRLTRYPPPPEPRPNPIPTRTATARNCDPLHTGRLSLAVHCGVASESEMSLATHAIAVTGQLAADLRRSPRNRLATQKLALVLADRLRRQRHSQV